MKTLKDPIVTAVTTRPPTPRSIKKTLWLHFQDFVIKADDIVRIYVNSNNGWNAHNVTLDNDGNGNKVVIEAKRGITHTVRRDLTLVQARTLVRELVAAIATPETNTIVYMQDPPAGQGWR